jgi:N,N'-diacetyllegionaminate synthase
VGVEVLKAPSGELDNLAFLRELASHRLPLIVSTGLGTLDEVAAALDAAAAAPVALLHCVTAYPAPVEESNLRALTTMSARFRVPVGWSDHTAGCLTAVGAVALGACILEKHLTLDHSMPGPDHAASADPAGFGEYVRSVRQVEAALGDGEKRPTPTEAENRVHARRSHHARRDLHPGDVLTAADVMLLRPATGIPASMGVTGRMVARSVLAGNALLFEDLE